MTTRSLRCLTGLQPCDGPTDQPVSGGAEAESWDLSTHVDAVIDCLTDHAIATLDKDGRIASWNRAAQATTGFRRSDIIGEHISIFYTEADRQQGLPGRHLHLAATEGLHRTEGWRLRKTGEPFWAREALQIVANPDDTIAGFVMVARDISAQNELNELRDAHERSRKLEALGRLTGGLVSDLGGVFDDIAAGHDLGLALGTNQRLVQAMAAGRDAALRGQKLLLQLQAFWRRQAGCPQPSNLGDMIASMDTLVACTAGGMTDLRWRLDASHISVVADPLWLQTILLEMVDAARATLPPGGVMTVFAEGRCDVASGSGEHGLAAIGVSTSGTEKIHHLALPASGDPALEAATRSSRARWLDFARQAGGSLKIETQPCRGTTTTLLLPAQAAPRVAGNFGRAASRTVLLVDDDPNVLSLVGEMLTYLGHTVVQAQDSAAAMTRLQADNAIDCLFSDILMPSGMNGVQLMQAARSARPGLRTALASVRSRDEVREIGDIPVDVAFFEKPYAMAEVSAYLAA